MKNFYRELPEGYKEFKVIDAKEDKKVIILFNIINIILLIVSITPFCIFALDINYDNVQYLDLLLSSLIFIAGCALYIILHELTHGLFYKILTKEKLTFGLTLSVAFCGVPHIYVSKKTALLSVLAPFVIFTLIFIPLIFIVSNGIYRLIVIILFGIHFGGCVGDLWVTLILLKNRGKILMNDTGPKQTFYKLEEN